MLRERLRTLLKVAISLVLIAYIFTRPSIQNVDWGDVLSQVRAGPWLLAVAIYFVAIGLNVLKWQYLLRTLEIPVPFPSLFRHNLVGLFFANLPLSMVGADIARGWDLARSTEGKTAEVAVSVFVDRLVGLASFLLAAVAGLACAVILLDRPDLTWLVSTLGLILVGFLTAFAMLMSERLRHLVERVLNIGPLRRGLTLYQGLSDSVQVYRTHLTALVVALGIGLLTVASTCVVNYLAALSVGADVTVGWVFILTPLTAFAPFLPSIASGLGWNQGAFIVLYTELTGLVPPGTALVMSLAMQLIIILASLPGGVLWWRKSTSPTRIANSL